MIPAPDHRPLDPQRLRAALDEGAGPGRTDQLADLVALASRTRQRPAWTFPERWLPMTVALQPAVVPRAHLALLAAALLSLISLAALLAGQGSPAPMSLERAHNGLIAFDSGDGNIYVADPDGGRPRPFLDREAELRWPAWAPDGAHLAYFEMVSTGPERTDDRALVRVVDADGKGDTDLTGGQALTPSISSHWRTDASPAGLAWSPDSRWLALSVLVAQPPGSAAVHPAIVVIAADGSGVTPLPLPLDAYDPAWSPSGDRLAFHAQTRFEDSTTGVWTSKADGSGATLVLSADGTGPHDLETDYSFSGPRWDPTGQWIITFVSDDTSESDHDIWVVGAEGESPHRLLDDPTPEWYPSWSPDGGLVGYQGFDAEGALGLRTVHADGTGPAVLQTGSGNDGNGPLVWAPDGDAMLTYTGESTSDGRQMTHPTIVHIDPSVPPTIISDPGGPRPTDWSEWMGLTWQPLGG